jgi:hypothetical protein
MPSIPPAGKWYKELKDAILSLEKHRDRYPVRRKADKASEPQAVFPGRDSGRGMPPG